MSLRIILVMLGVFTYGIAHADDHRSEFLDVGAGWKPSRAATRISPDGGKIVYTRRYIDRSMIALSRRCGSWRRRRREHLDGGSNPRWSPDGSRLCLQARTRMASPRCLSDGWMMRVRSPR